MKRLRFSKVVCSVFAAAIVCGAFAQSASDAFKELQAAVEKEAAKKKPDDEQLSRYGGGGDAGVMMLAQLRAAITRGEPPQLDETLNQITVYFKSEAVRTAAEKLRAQIRAEREAREKAFVEQIQSVLVDAAKAVQTASKPADLDNALRDLSKAPERREDRISESERAELSKLSAARQFVIHWQDYLANRDAGNVQQAVQNLQNASNANAPDLIPRSEILARIASLSGAKPTSNEVMRDIMEKTKSLNDISAALDTLSKLTSQPGVPHDANDPDMILRNELSAIHSAWQNFQAGIPNVVQLQPMPGMGAQNADAMRMAFPLKMQLLRLVAPRFLGVDEKPKPDEALGDYLGRLKADAIERLDTKLLVRIYDLQSKLSGTPDSAPKPAAFNVLITAQNQEEAGQFVPAVISYETALKTGGDLVPAKVIGARLNAIKAAHPTEFEQAMQRFLNASEPTPTPRATIGSSGTSVSIPGDASRWSGSQRPSGSGVVDSPR